MTTRFALNVLLTVFLFPLFGAPSQEILVSTSRGECFSFELTPEDSVLALSERLLPFLDEQEEEQHLLVELTLNHKAKKADFWNWEVANQGQGLGYPRDYEIPVTRQEASDIGFIVTSLANKSLISIALMKGELEAAGDRIEHVHPLRFLMTVFTHEELKVGIRNVRGKGWVWNIFVGGLKESLRNETKIGNMKEPFLRHFASTVGVDLELMRPLIQAQRWDEFIDLLITEIPRNGDHNRYDD